MATKSVTATAALVNPQPEGVRLVEQRLSVKQMQSVFQEIADLAYRLDREFFCSGYGGVDDLPESTQLFLSRLRDAINHMGWLADLPHGGVRYQEQRAWLLPPDFSTEPSEVEQ